MTIESLGSFFGSSSAGVSSHFGADNYQRGTVGAYVQEQHKAWTQGNANPYCLSMELCAYAAYSRDKWLNEQGTLLHNAADWVAWMTKKYNVPLRALSNADAQNPDVKGVCQHINFGSWGGGHVDCGSGFPMDKVLEWAASGAPSSESETDMIPAVASYNNQAYYAWVGDKGVIRYKGPDTDYEPCTIDSSAGAIGGCGMHITPSGWTFVTFTNSTGDPYVDRRAPGGAGGWERFRLEDLPN